MAIGKRRILLAGFAVFSAVSMGGIIGFQAYRTKATLQQDGYVNWVSDEREYEMVNFQGGTGYRYIYPEKVAFRDQEGKRYVMDNDIFVHYSDRSVGSFSDGILLDTGRIQTGMVQSYYLETGTMVVSRDSTYYIENNGAEIAFQNFIWKAGGSHYLVAGSGIELTGPDGTKVTPDGYVEVTYLEDGVVQLIADEQMWTVVSAGSQITWGDGILDLGARLVSNEDGSQNILLDTIGESPEGSIQVASTTENWSTVHPSWNFTVIDGTNGEDGEAGETGEDGAAGVQGERGGDGQAGAAGKDGDAGQEGERGKSSFAQIITDAVADTRVEMDDYEVSEHQIYGAFRFYMGDWTLQNLQLKIVEEEGQEVAVIGFEQQDDLQQSSNGWILEGGTSLEDDEIYDMTFSYGDDLEPDTQYQLILTADYYNDDVHMGNKVFLSRSFYTDSQGIRIRTQGVTEDSVSLELSRKNVSQELTLVLYDSRREELDRITTELRNGSGGLRTKLDLDGLDSDTEYYIGVMNNGTEGELLKVTTLKKMPQMGTLKAELGIGNYRLYFEENDDPDGAIVGYSYEILDESVGTTAVKTLISTASNGEAKAVFDNQILHYNTEYTVKAWITCFDNEKYIRLEEELEDDPLTTDFDEGVLKAVELQFPSFAPLEGKYSLTSNSFSGRLRLQIPADTVYQVYYGGRDENPIYLMVLSNSGEYREPKIFTYTWQALLEPKSVWITYPQDGGGRVNLDVNLELTGLNPSTDYYVYLFGDYANLAMIDQDMAYASGFGMLGSCKITTKKN